MCSRRRATAACPSTATTSPGDRRSPRPAGRSRSPRRGARASRSPSPGSAGRPARAPAATRRCSGWPPPSSARGHTCVLYLNDRHGWELEQHRRTIRTWWPWVRAEVRDVAAGIEDAHAVFATSWETAYPVLASPAKGARFYFVQDFEPLVLPRRQRGAARRGDLPASASTGSPPGAGSPTCCAREYGMAADHFDFGCDLDRTGSTARPTLHAAHGRLLLLPARRRPGGRTSSAVLALDLFAARHPEVDIHPYGEPRRRGFRSPRPTTAC